EAHDGEGGKRRALLQTVGDQIFLHAVDLAAAHAHRVDHGHAAGGDIVAVAHPAGRLPGDALAEVGAGAFDQFEQGFGVRGQRLGRAAESAVHLDPDVALGGDGGDRGVDQVARPLFVVRRAGTEIDAQDGEVGDDVAWAPAVDPRGVDAQARIFAGGKMEGEVGRGEEGVAPVLGVAPGVGRAAVDDDREI